MGLADSVAAGWYLPLSWLLSRPPVAPARSLDTIKLLDQRRLRCVDLPDDAMDAMASVIGGAGA
jgi:hypothetical protein